MHVDEAAMRGLELALVALFRNNIASAHNLVPDPPGAQVRHRNTSSRGGIDAPSVRPSPQPGHCRIDGYTPCRRNSQYSKYRASASTGAPMAMASMIDD